METAKLSSKSAEFCRMVPVATGVPWNDALCMHVRAGGSGHASDWRGLARFVARKRVARLRHERYMSLGFDSLSSELRLCVVAFINAFSLLTRSRCCVDDIGSAESRRD